MADETPRITNELIRPVRVDEETGYIYEMSGERYIFPGLEPESILRALADEREGRLTNYKVYISNRRKSGV